jgi:hypothetical protein
MRRGHRTNSIVRGFFRAAGAHPSLFFLFIAPGLATGAFLVCFAPGLSPHESFLSRVAGAICLLFYGTLLLFFIRKQQTGGWREACDYGYKLFLDDPALRPIYPPSSRKAATHDTHIHSGITIRRRFEFFAMARNLAVFVNGEDVGLIPFNSTRSFALEPGEYEIFVQMDWCYSKPTYVDIVDTNIVRLECGTRFILPLSMIGIAFWPDRFFFIRVISNKASVPAHAR